MQFVILKITIRHFVFFKNVCIPSEFCPNFKVLRVWCDNKCQLFFLSTRIFFEISGTERPCKHMVIEGDYVQLSYIYKAPCTGEFGN